MLVKGASAHSSFAPRTSASVALAWLAAVLCLAGPQPSRARAQAANTSLELTFVPADRAQIAVWVERDDGQFMGTLALTYATAVAGIGNRPGALEMNSGYRWPYGRREGALPVWAHRRAETPGAKQFKRVIFQNRTWEGLASRTSSDQSVDDYYCLSFNKTESSKDALDAVTCASVFSSDKGRFIDQADVAAGYAEPTEDENGVGSMRPLSLESLYPPRRDLKRCNNGTSCFDHVDVESYQQHAREVMPEIDAVTQATPPGLRRVSWSFTLPDEWSADHEYILYIEVNVEGDYNETWSAARFATPDQPSGKWDSWAMTFGYPYRAQPSVVYALPFTHGSSQVTTRTPAGYGAHEGQDGQLRPMDPTITDDPVGAPGSGADRLLDQSGVRASLKVLSADPCTRPDKPAACGQACSSMPSGCGELYCNPSSNMCESYCSATPAPSAVTELHVEPYPDPLKAHMWASLSFKSAPSQRPIGGYDVRVKPEGGDWTTAFTSDPVQELLPVALDVCSDPDDPMLNRCLTMQPGTQIDVGLAGLSQSTKYEVAVTPRDSLCSELGPMMTAEFTTPERTFSTVSPCFVATATYGSPLAREVGVLRRVRDRYLASHAPGRALIAAYYRVGPELAAYVRAHGWLRDLSLRLISPVVALARWWDE